MATKVTVSVKGSGSHIVDCEISGGADFKLGTGSRDVSIGADGSIVQFLTVVRLAPGVVSIKADTGDVVISVDGAKDKSVKKGKSLSLSSERETCGGERETKKNRGRDG